MYLSDLYVRTLATRNDDKMTELFHYFFLQFFGTAIKRLGTGRIWQCTIYNIPITSTADAA